MRDATDTTTDTSRKWPFLSAWPFRSKAFVLLVPGGGVEPPRPCGRRILSPLRLPVPPSRHISLRCLLYLYPVRKISQANHAEIHGSRTSHRPDALNASATELYRVLYVAEKGVDSAQVFAEHTIDENAYVSQVEEPRWFNRGSSLESQGAIPPLLDRSF